MARDQKDNIGLSRGKPESIKPRGLTLQYHRPRGISTGDLTEYYNWQRAHYWPTSPLPAVQSYRNYTSTSSAVNMICLSPAPVVHSSPTLVKLSSCQGITLFTFLINPQCEGQQLAGHLAPKFLSAISHPPLPPPGLLLAACPTCRKPTLEAATAHERKKVWRQKMGFMGAYI